MRVLGIALPLSVAALSLFGSACDPLLDIEGERTLDTSVLDAEGYAGCVPADGDCPSCTSGFHDCVCQGWYDSTDDRERRDLQWVCAGEFAPPEGVDLDKLKRDYDEYRSEAE